MYIVVWHTTNGRSFYDVVNDQTEEVLFTFTTQAAAQWIVDCLNN